MNLEDIYNPNTKKIIKNWFKKWKDETNYFDKFIYFWISFNAFYCWITLNDDWKTHDYKEFLCENEKIDWDMNKVLFFAEKNQDLFEDFIKDNEKNNIYFKFIWSREHPNYPEKDKWWVVRLDKPKKIIRYKKNNNLKDFISIIYQVRSNLFHWWKSSDSENSRELIEQTNLIFESFLKVLYNLES